MAGMKARPDSVGIACEALNNLFSKGEEDLVSQALNCNIIPYLLSLLEGGPLYVKLCHCYISSNTLLTRVYVGLTKQNTTILDLSEL